MRTSTRTLIPALLVAISLPAGAGTIFSDNFSSYAGTISTTALGTTWEVIASSNAMGQPTYLGSVDMISPLPGSGPLSTAGWTQICGLAGGSDHCVDLSGSGPVNAQGQPSGQAIPTGGYLRLVNPLTFTPGLSYTLAFRLAGSQRPTDQAQGALPDASLTSNTVRFGIEGMPSSFRTLTLQENDPFQVFELSFVASAAAGRIFIDNSGNMGVWPDTPGYGINNPGFAGALMDNVLLIDSPEPATMSLMALAFGLGGLLLRRRVQR